MTSPALDLDCVRAFLAIADLRSFTRAALSLHRTQSAVSMQMKRLEGQLGVALLRRSKAGVDLTLAGERFRGDARRLVALNDETVGRLAEHNLDGHVRLGAMEDYSAYLIPPLLASFVAAYPNIRVEMETGLTYAMPERLGEAYDVVVAMHPEGARDGEFLRSEQAVWAGSQTHGAEEREPLPVALHPPGCLFRKWAMERLDGAKRPWRLAFVTHSLAAAESIAAQGLAVTVAKAGTFPARLRPLGERDGVPSLPAAEIRLHRAKRLPRAGALLADHLAAGLSRPLPRTEAAP
jgi:DNA-binding transcriptional LysR family regulator